MRNSMTCIFRDNLDSLYQEVSMKLKEMFYLKFGPTPPFVSCGKTPSSSYSCDVIFVSFSCEKSLHGQRTLTLLAHWLHRGDLKMLCP